MNAAMFGRKSVIFVALAILQIAKHTSAQNTTVSANTTVSLSSASSTSVPASSQPPTANPAPSQSYFTLPTNITVELGDPVVFWCGVPKSSGGLTFTFYGSAHNYTLSCPSGHIEDIPQALTGLCVIHAQEMLGAFVLKGTSIPDNGTKVVCQNRGQPAAPPAYLRVYDKGSGNGLLIGLAIGGVFGIITVFGLFYLMFTKSERLQMCCSGNDRRPDDIIEIMDNIEPTATSKPNLNEKMRDL